MLIQGVFACFFIFVRQKVMVLIFTPFPYLHSRGWERMECCRGSNRIWQTLQLASPNHFFAILSLQTPQYGKLIETAMPSQFVTQLLHFLPLQCLGWDFQFHPWIALNTRVKTLRRFDWDPDSCVQWWIMNKNTHIAPSLASILLCKQCLLNTI